MTLDEIRVADVATLIKRKEVVGNRHLPVCRDMHPKYVARYEEELGSIEKRLAEIKSEEGMSCKLDELIHHRDYLIRESIPLWEAAVAKDPSSKRNSMMLAGRREQLRQAEKEIAEIKSAEAPKSFNPYDFSELQKLLGEKELSMPAEVKKTGFTDVQKAVHIALKKEELMDVYMRAAAERMAEQIAKKIEPLTSKRVEEGREALAKDVEENYKRAMGEVSEGIDAIARDMERRVAEAAAAKDMTITIEYTKAPEDDITEGEIVATEKITGLFHKLFPTLLLLIKTGNPLILTGPTQSAKSFHVQKAAETLGLKYYYHAFGPTQTETALAGFNSATGEYVFRTLYLAAKYGGIWCGDEMDVVRDAGVLIWMNNGISNGTWSFPIGIKNKMLEAFEEEGDTAELDEIKKTFEIAGGMVKSHPDFKVLGTMNTYGEGGNMTYSGRGRIDKSTLARFDFLHWGYDEELERALVLRAVKHTQASRWIHWCQALRAAVDEEKLAEQVIVSPSNTMRGAKNLAAGLSWAQVTEMSVLPRSIEQGARERVISAAQRIYRDKTGERARLW